MVINQIFQKIKHKKRLEEKGGSCYEFASGKTYITYSNHIKKMARKAVMTLCMCDSGLVEKIDSELETTDITNIVFGFIEKNYNLLAENPRYFKRYTLCHLPEMYLDKLKQKNQKDYVPGQNL